MSKTILVVDDTENLRTLVKSYLSQEGFRVLTAADGRQALFLARDEKPDLILLDLMMPEMDGFEFLDELRDRPDAVEIPVVVLTAMELTEEDRARLNGDVARVLSKGGGSAAELSRELRRLVGRPD